MATFEIKEDVCKQFFVKKTKRFTVIASEDSDALFLSLIKNETGEDFCVNCWIKKDYRALPRETIKKKARKLINILKEKGE